MTYQISADTGGTFIDVVIRDSDGREEIGKALTTHDRVSRGLFEAVETAAEPFDLDLKSILAETDLFIYGTTRATNAIVTRNVAKTALLTTEGFTDVLVLKEGGKLRAHDFSHGYPEPYIPRSRTFAVKERVSSEGAVTVELDEDAVRSTLRTLKEGNYEAIAVALLWSIVNSVHEVRVGELIEEALPGVPYTLSHDLVPIIREYRRASATAIDASLKPLMQQHFRQLQADLSGAGYQAQLLVSTSMGGVMSIDEVIESPIHAAKSGPAMAPVAGVAYSLAEGFGGDMLVCDTGGTTFDVGLTRDGQQIYTRDTWLGGMWEGDLLGISSVDIRSVGSGGGSIAWVDEGGLLRVGPQSAGSEPGPACYGLGGTAPTVSDAATVLGYLNPDNFLGGRMALDVEAANGVLDKLGAQLGIGRYEAAWGVLTLANDTMIKAVQEVATSQGLNPIDATIVAGGGAAGINIMNIAKELGSRHVVLPQVASALSASGMHFADIIKEEAHAHITSTARFDFEGVNATLDLLESKLQAFLERTGLQNSRATVELVAEARYQAQVWDVDATLPFRRFTSNADLARFVEEFHRSHERIFAIRDEGSAIEIINWKARLAVELSEDRPDPFHTQAGRTSQHEERACYFGTSDPVPTSIYRPEHLDVGSLVHGPAIIEEPTTTLVVYPGMTAEVSTTRNYILHAEGITR
jgi:N-methylhydantoinase A